MSVFLVWFKTNYIEFVGVITGIIYIFLSVKQNILLWPVGIITSVFQLIVFYKSGIYADMGLQAYYVIISIYGWIFWIIGKKKNEKKLPVIKMTSIHWVFFLSGTFIIFLIIKFILSNYTDSMVPVVDSFTTSLSISGTFLLARKYIENWYAWIIVDVVSIGLYMYKGLYLMMGLYGFLSVMAVIGLIKWKKDLQIT